MQLKKSYYEYYGPKDKPDIGFSCRCLSERRRTLISANVLTEEKYKSLEKKWTYNMIQDHKAINDARYQGIVYCKLAKVTT